MSDPLGFPTSMSMHAQQLADTMEDFARNQMGRTILLRAASGLVLCGVAGTVFAFMLSVWLGAAFIAAQTIHAWWCARPYYRWAREEAQREAAERRMMAAARAFDEGERNGWVQ